MNAAVLVPLVMAGAVAVVIGVRQRRRIAQLEEDAVIRRRLLRVLIDQRVRQMEDLGVDDLELMLALGVDLESARAARAPDGPCSAEGG